MAGVDPEVFGTAVIRDDGLTFDDARQAAKHERMATRTFRRCVEEGTPVHGHVWEPLLAYAAPYPDPTSDWSRIDCHSEDELDRAVAAYEAGVPGPVLVEKWGLTSSQLGKLSRSRRAASRQGATGRGSADDAGSHVCVEGGAPQGAPNRAVADEGAQDAR